MRITELIKKLEEAQELHGDVEVYAWPYDGQALWANQDGSLAEPNLTFVKNAEAKGTSYVYGDENSGQFQTRKVDVLFLND